MTGHLLAGAAEAALIAVAIGAAFALLACILGLAPSSADQARSCADAHKSTTTQSQKNREKEASFRAESHDVRNDPDSRR
jgi:gas vesicle protein